MTRMSFSLVFGMAFVFASFVPMAEASTDSCGPRLGKILFSATFPGTKSKATHSPRLKLLIGQLRDEETAVQARPRTPLQARILLGSSCQAVCQVTPSLSLSDAESSALDLDCHASQLNALTTSATLFLPSRRQTSSLRFGTWLNGYRRTPLLVELSRIGSRDFARR